MPISFIPYTATYGPLSLPGVTCQLWLDGADPAGNGILPANNSSLTSWFDKSKSGNTCTNTSSANSPIFNTNLINGLSALSFTGPGVFNTTTSQWLDNTIMSFPNTTNTIFAVVYNDNSTSKSFTTNNYIISGRADALISYSSYTGNNFATFIGSGSTWNDASINTPSQNMNGVWAITAMTLNTNVLTPYYNGTALNTKSGTMASTTGFIIGEAPLGYRGQCWNGYIAEVLIYNSVLGTSQRQAIEGYLAQKWGLTAKLPPGHPGLSQTLYNGKVYQPQISLKSAPYANYYPLSIGGCVLWLDGNDTSSMTFNGSAIIQWNDKSPSSNYVSQATVANAPTLGTSQNGLNTVYFATTNQQLVSSQNSATPGNASRTVIALFWCPTLSSQYMSVTGTESGANPAPAWGMAKNANADVDYPFMYSSAGYDQYTFVYSTPNPLLTYAQYDSDASFFSGYYATAGATGGTTTVGNFATRTMTFNTTAGVWYIGRRQQAATGSVTSHLLEMIQYNRALTTTERQSIEGYLTWKWGLTTLLASTHPYYSAPPLQYTRGAILGAPIKTGISFVPSNYIAMTLTGSSAGAVTNYQIPITVYRTTGTNSGSSVYVGTAIYSDYSNLYFLASDRVTQLPFYIESSTVTATSAIIWVSVPSIPASPSTVKVYLYWYLSGTYTSSQNGTNTFLLFDEFTGAAASAPNSSIWTLNVKGSGGTGALTGSGTIQLSPTNLTISSVSILSVNTLPANNFCIHVRRQFSGIQYTDITFAQTNSVQDLDAGGQSSWWHTTLAQGYLVEKQNISGQDHLMIKGATNTGASDLTPLFGSTPVNTWELIDFTYTSSGLLNWSVNGSSQASATNTTYLSGAKYLLISQGMYSSTSGYVTTLDYVFVRNYVNPEPSVTAWGALNTP